MERSESVCCIRCEFDLDSTLFGVPILRFKCCEFDLDSTPFGVPTLRFMFVGVEPVLLRADSTNTSLDVASPKMYVDVGVDARLLRAELRNTSRFDDELIRNLSFLACNVPTELVTPAVARMAVEGVSVFVGEPSLHMDVCMCVCMYIYIYIYMCTRGVSVFVGEPSLHMDVCMCVCMYVYVHITLCVHVYVYVYVYKFMCILIHSANGRNE
jgi:hypothetical protein